MTQIRYPLPTAELSLADHYILCRPYPSLTSQSTTDVIRSRPPSHGPKSIGLNVCNTSTRMSHPFSGQKGHIGPILPPTISCQFEHSFIIGWTSARRTLPPAHSPSQHSTYAQPSKRWPGQSCHLLILITVERVPNPCYHDRMVASNNRPSTKNAKSPLRSQVRRLLIPMFKA